jgi:hypothetical protein
MNEEKLKEALRKLGDENAAAPAPPEIAAKVMAAFDARHRARTRWWIPAMAAALACAFALAAFLMRRPLPPRAEAPFTAIPYVAPPAPYERTEVKRMDVPLAALLAAGIHLRATTTGGTVRADVLVGQDGRPLAIRLVENAI